MILSSKILCSRGMPDTIICLIAWSGSSLLNYSYYQNAAILRVFSIQVYKYERVLGYLSYQPSYQQKLLSPDSQLQIIAFSTTPSLESIAPFKLIS